MADDGSEVEFFGARIKVKNAALAALLNSGMTDDVVVVGKRAKDALVKEDDEEELNATLGSAAQVIPIRPTASEPDEK
jgi:hypothetical protein